MDTEAEHRVDEDYARRLDADDPLLSFRERFRIPIGSDGVELAYLCGNSLGLQPDAACRAVEREIETWGGLAVDGWFSGPSPWYGYDERLREPMADLVGARASEVAVMNALTVNLHLMLASFYRPVGSRRLVLVDHPVFPSDRYALETHLRHRGIEPAEGLIELRPRAGERLIRQEDFEDRLAESGDDIALVLAGGVNYLTGQFLDLERIAAAARDRGCVIGVDLAHAVGNVPLRLHDWDVDFAVWCNYKYVNGGPGAVAGCFVHERHSRDVNRSRLGGWWGNDPATRFEMLPTFEPRPDALGWQISTPAVLTMAPLEPALALFQEAGLDALRRKSVRLTAYLEWLVQRVAGGRVELMTPRDPARRGCQLSLSMEGAREARRVLAEADVVADFREPDVIRLAPAPLYNTFHDVWRAARALEAALDETGGGRSGP